MGAEQAQVSTDPLQLALTLQERGDYHASQVACEAIHEKGTDNPAKLYHIEALNFFHLRQADAALERLDQSLAINPDDPQVYEHLVKILSHLGEKQLAGQSLLVSAARILEAKAAPYEILHALRYRLCGDETIDWARQLGFLKLVTSSVTIPKKEVIPEAHLSDLTRKLSELQVSEQEFTTRLTLLLETLSFKKTSTLAWNERLFTHLVLPLMKLLLEKSHFNLALKLEATIYNVIIKQKETETHFNQHFSQWVPEMEQAGKSVSKSLQKLESPVTDKPKIAFFVHSASRLAHVELMMNMFNGLQELPEIPFSPSVIAFSGDSSELRESLAKMAIPFHAMDGHYPELKDQYFDKLLKVRAYCEAENITAIVWVSVETLMAMAFSIRMAPVQIWWAMKYHGAELESMDGCVTGGSLSKFKKIGGRTWRAARIGHTSWTTPEHAEKALSHREQFQPYSLLLGSFGREEKLSNPQFLQTVAEILKVHPECAYLWTGRVQLESIQNAFEQAGVASQCFYIGWVDTRFYAHVIDIFLDSFPFPCGFTALEAMALAKPIIFYASSESSTTGIRGAISPLLEGTEGTGQQQTQMRQLLKYNSAQTLYSCAKTPEEYALLTGKLIEDASYRKESGEACKKVVDTFFSDKSAMAESYAEHFIDIINENTSKG